MSDCQPLIPKTNDSIYTLYQEKCLLNSLHTCKDQGVKSMKIRQKCKSTRNYAAFVKYASVLILVLHVYSLNIRQWWCSFGILHVDVNRTWKENQTPCLTHFLPHPFLNTPIYTVPEIWSYATFYLLSTRLLDAHGHGLKVSFDI